MNHKHTLTFLIIFGLAIGMTAGMQAHALSVEGETPACATLLKFEGDVQILDSTRTNLIETNLNSQVPCGGWISVRNGWVEIEHQVKRKIRAASDTFFLVQGNDHLAESKAPDDLIVLYKGRILVEQGSQAFSVGTANARALVDQGAALVLYLQNAQETQLIALEESSTLLNRFEPKNSIKLKSGELTNLALNDTRVVPSTPNPVKAVSLQTQLEGLGLQSQVKAEYLAKIDQRGNRTIASSLLEKPKNAHARNPASYTRYSKDSASDTKAESAWLSRLTGGESGALIYPKEGKKHGSQSEKRRLLEEISQIRE